MLEQCVVADIGAADRVARDGDGTGADVLAGKRADGGAPERDGVAAQRGDGGAAAQDGSLVGVIDLVGGGDAGDGEVGLGDGRAQSSLLEQCVVAGVTATDRVAGDGDVFAGTEVFGIEGTCCRATKGDNITVKCSDCCGAAKCSGGKRVVGFVAGGQAGDGQISFAYGQFI